MEASNVASGSYPPPDPIHFRRPDEPTRCVCGRRFTRLTGVDAHIARDNRDIVCSLCHKAFGRTSDRQRHLREVHEQQREYSCPWAYCDRHSDGFSRKDRLNSHLLHKHNGARPTQAAATDDITSPPNLTISNPLNEAPRTVSARLSSSSAVQPVAVQSPHDAVPIGGLPYGTMYNPYGPSANPTLARDFHAVQCEYMDLQGCYNRSKEALERSEEELERFRSAKFRLEDHITRLLCPSGTKFGFLE